MAAFPRQPARYVHASAVLFGRDGLAKTVVLVSRLKLFWGLKRRAVADHFTSETDVSNFDIVSGCVDTRTSRLLIHYRMQDRRSRIAYWLDLGNSADSGQFVLGQPLNSRNRRSAARLRTAPELFPEIADPSLEDDGIPKIASAQTVVDIDIGCLALLSGFSWFHLIDPRTPTRLRTFWR